MFEWTQTAIDDLESELDALNDRRGEIEKVLETLRSFAGNEEPATPRGRLGKKPRKSAAAGRGKPEGLPDGAVIVQALKAAGEPMAPSDLAKATKLSMFTLRKRLKSLAKERLIVLTGKTMSRRVALPGKQAKEEH